MQRELSRLSRLLGHEVIVEVDWQRLLDEYGEQDNPTIVRVAAEILHAWCTGLRIMLSRTEIDDWLERLLNCVVKAGRKLRVMLDVWENTLPGTSWSGERKGFFVHLPRHFLFAKKAFEKGHLSLRVQFEKELLSCDLQVMEEPTRDTKPEPEMVAGTATELESALEHLGVRDDHTDGEESGALAAARHATTTASAPSSIEPARTPFPTVDSLPSLVELCSNPPYHLTITEKWNEKWINIYGSHGQSIKLIDDYIYKWAPKVFMTSADIPSTDTPSTNVNPEANSKLSVLAIERDCRGPGRRYSMSMPLVLAIVEGILGYQIVWQGVGECRLRRDVPFSD